MAAKSASMLASGGKPVLDWTDVSGALGFAEDKFCEEMFGAGRDGPSLVSWSRCDALIEARQFAEWRERAERFVAAQLAEAVAQRNLSWRNTLHAGLMMQGAKAALWPHLRAPQWAHIRAVVVAELRGRPLCMACHGQVARSSPRQPFLARTKNVCPATEAAESGFPDRKRAEQIDIDL